jgi:uncharacterized protein
VTIVSEALTRVGVRALPGLAGTLLAAARLLVGHTHVIFRPRAGGFATPATLHLAYENLQLRTRTGLSVQGWWIDGTRSDRTVLFLHGSESNLAYELVTLRFLHALGPNVLMVEYPGYGRSEGRPTEQGCYDAADAAWCFATATKGISSSDVILYGFSLGCAPATYLAAKNTCAGLVFQSGFTSVPDMAALAFPFLPARWLCRVNLDSLGRIARCRCPVLVIHSAEDEHIPITQAQRVFAQAPQPKRFLITHGPHHTTEWQSDPAVVGAWTELLACETDEWRRANRSTSFMAPYR